MKYTREVKIGVFTIIVVIAFIIGINFIKGISIFDTQRYYYSIFNTASGLSKADPVIIRGLKVGSVASVDFYDSKLDKILVKFSVSKKFKFPNDSKIKLNTSLLGSRNLEVIPGTNAQIVNNGDTILSVPNTSFMEELSPLKSSTENVVHSLDSFLISMQNVLNVETQKNIISSFESLQKTLQNLQNASTTLNSTLSSEKERLSMIMKNLETISQTFSDNSSNISKIIKNASDITDSIAKSNISSTFTKLNSSVTHLESVVSKIEKGDGTLGMLVNDNQLYTNLEKATLELQLLLNDIKANPNRYINISVFGKKN